MIRNYLNLLKKYPYVILTLGFTYSATIVFTFFGPVLELVAKGFAPLLSIVAVVFHVLGFILKPRLFKNQPQYLYYYLVILIPLLLLFNIVPLYLKLIIVSLYAYLIGRLGCLWTYKANIVIPDHIRGKILSASLFISFAILYLTNISMPLFSENISLLLPVLLSSLSVFLYQRLEQQCKHSTINNSTKQRTPSYLLFIFLIIVYIAGGYSYAGIYPSFKTYAQIDIYYNVLAYLVAVLGAGIILDKYGRKLAFTLGVGFLGISFTFFIMPSSVLTYFITQTFLQAGWAFVNSFGWSFSWDMAANHDNNKLFAQGIGAMLLGTSIGACVAHFSFKFTFISGVATFIPLFLAVILLNFFPETLNNDERKLTFEQFKIIKELAELTPREVEVCYFMVRAFSNNQICKTLNISQNTVKTHISRIYSKLELSSRSELRSYFNNLV